MRTHEHQEQWRAEAQSLPYPHSNVRFPKIVNVITCPMFRTKALFISFFVWSTILMWKRPVEEKKGIRPRAGRQKLGCGYDFLFSEKTSVELRATVGNLEVVADDAARKGAQSRAVRQRKSPKFEERLRCTHARVSNSCLSCLHCVTTDDT